MCCLQDTTRQWIKTVKESERRGLLTILLLLLYLFNINEILRAICVYYPGGH